MLIEFAVVSSGTVLWGKLKKKHKQRVLAKKQNSAVFNGKQLLADMKSVLVNDERRELQESLEPKLVAANTVKQRRTGRNMLLSIGAVGLAILGASSPAFYLLGSAAVLYLGRHLYQMVWRDLKQGHFISVPLVNAILVLGMILSGGLLYSAVAAVLSGFMFQLIKKAEDSSQKQLVDIFGQPDKVWIEKDGVEIQVEFDSVHRGDTVIVQAGEVIPIDGVILKGAANIDQHILTGESQPVEREAGESVFAATLVLSGRISILVETAGSETVAANIGNVLNNTKDYKDHLMLRGRKIADRLLPVEAGLGAATYALLGPIPALSVMWSGLGYRMIMLGPLSVLNYLQILSRRGILVKDGRVLESLRKVDTVVFDKTGTLTEEQPTLSEIHTFADYDELQVLQFAASAEHRQTHPVARAIITKAEQFRLELSEPENSSYEVGFGIKVKIRGQMVRVGSARFMELEGLPLPDNAPNLRQQAETSGHSLIFVGINDLVAGALELQPSIRAEAVELVKYLKQRGIATYIISGDYTEPTRNIAQKLGIDHYFAETLPENKSELVQQLRDDGKFVCFIGDGINDAIALKSAQVSISLKGASSAATDTAQIIFMDGTLSPMEYLFRFADDFERTMHRNFLISTVPGLINVGGVYLLGFGITTSMSIFYGSTILGLGNSIFPLVRHQNKKNTALLSSPKITDGDKNKIH